MCIERRPSHSYECLCPHFLEREIFTQFIRLFKQSVCCAIERRPPHLHKCLWPQFFRTRNIHALILLVFLFVFPQVSQSSWCAIIFTHFIRLSSERRLSLLYECLWPHLVRTRNIPTLLSPVYFCLPLGCLRVSSSTDSTNVCNFTFC